MSVSFDIYRPELDNIVTLIDDAIKRTYDEALRNRSKNLIRDSSKPSTPVPTIPPTALKQEIMIGVVKRLEEHFKKSNKEKVLTQEQKLFTQLIQQNLSKYVENYQKEKEIEKTSPHSKEQSKNNDKKAQQEKSQLTKITQAALFIAALTYSSITIARINAIKKLKKSKLMIAYQKWRKRRIEKLKESERKAQEEEEANKVPTAEDLQKQKEEYERELSIIWGDMFRKEPSDEAFEFMAAVSAENFGDNIHSEISDLHQSLSKELNLPKMKPEDELKFKEDIEKFKLALFEIDQSLTKGSSHKTPEGFAQTSAHIIEAAYSKFEQDILGRLNEWRENTKNMIGQANEMAHQLIDDRFAKLTNGLLDWARGEPVLRKEDLKVAAENKMSQENSMMAGQDLEVSNRADASQNSPTHNRDEMLRGNAERDIALLKVKAKIPTAAAFLSSFNAKRDASQEARRAAAEAEAQASLARNKLPQPPSPGADSSNSSR